MKLSPFHDLLSRRDAEADAHYLDAAFEDRHFIDWNGYYLPMDQGDPAYEYRAVRDQCALFDVTPLRKLRLKGADTGRLLDGLLTRPVSHLAPMQGQYVVFCNDDGSFKDDALIHKYAEDDYLLIPSDIDHLPWLQTVADRLGLTQLQMVDETADFAAIAFQGPASAWVLAQLGLSGIESLPNMHLRHYEPFGDSFLVARMGFTGGLGYECWLSPEQVPALKDAIRDLRRREDIPLPGYGLTTLEACRLEGGFIVAGWDCATEADPAHGFERSPYELGLSWLVNLEEMDFPGRQALQEERGRGSRYLLRQFTLDARSGPEDHAVVYARPTPDSDVVGQVNCSAWSWDLGKTIGNVSLQAAQEDRTEAWLESDSGMLKIKLKSSPLRHFAEARQHPAPLIRGRTPST